MLFKEVPEPINWGCLGHSHVTMLHPREVISDKNPGSLSIETTAVVVSMLVGVKLRQVTISDAFHFMLIAVFLLLVFMLDAP